MLTACEPISDRPGYEAVHMDMSNKQVGNLDGFDGGFSERFEEDGKWSLRRGGYGIHLIGTWSRDSRGRICVVAPDLGEEPSWLDREVCRYLYRKDDAFYIEEFMIEGRRSGELQRVNVR